MVRSELIQNFGAQAIDSGYKVYTTINSQRQAYAEQSVQEGLEAYDRRHGWRGAEANDQPLKKFQPFANTHHCFNGTIIWIDGNQLTLNFRNLYQCPGSFLCIRT
jgi:membrane carboxypeptidase/penicillin-binding protein